MHYNKIELKKLEEEIEGLPIITAKKYISGKKLSKKVELALEDLEQNHNNSWAVEMYNRNKDNLDNIALYYRGNKINYGKLFEESYKYAKALKQIGYNKDDEVPICISNIPEFVYIMLGASFIGAKINVVGDWFNHDYLKSILNKTNSKYIFVSNDNYEYIKDAIDESNIEKIVMFSLTDSLMKDKDDNKIQKVKEFEIEVSDLNETNRLLEELGVVRRNYQEKIRYSYEYKNAEIENFI